MSTLDQIPLTQLKGVGDKLAQTFAKLSIYNLQDLLFHLPFRYEDRTKIIPIQHFRAGMHGLFEASVVSHRVVYGRRRSLEIIVEGGHSRVTLRFYHFSAAQTRLLGPGTLIRGYGEARLGKTGLEFYHPEYKVIDPDEPHQIPDRLTPLYPLTEGIQQGRIRALSQLALTWLDRCDVPDLLPNAVRDEFQLPELKVALRYLHAPPTDADQEALLSGSHPCQQRLILEELLAHHLSLLKLRTSLRSQAALACPLGADANQAINRFLGALPFTLTSAQQRVQQEIQADLSQPIPMLRLVQGDVGSGKTILAALSALQASTAGGQVALMAPTEILAEQHAQNFSRWFADTPLRLAWLSGKTKGKKRTEVLTAITNGDVDIIIGTHALFQDDVHYHRLALAIIDEQHRFGVHQRLSLKDKGLKAGIVPHQLIMTATPIPRTLAMSAYADLDTSVIDELPPGRQAIETFALSDSRREEMVSKVRTVCESGAQAYWVCTLIEESEALQCQAAENTAQWLSESLDGLSVALVHGRMKAQDKSTVMDAFAAGRVDVLVATTVIEVGVDVPDASLIVIENPERLGLAQLHQLRGRVGRGSRKSYCALMYHPPLSEHGKERLKVMRESSDGFVIAEKDLELRGPGEVLGTKQTGLIDFKIADLQRDQGWLEAVKAIAPTIRNPESIIQRWVGHSQKYAEV